MLVMMLDVFSPPEVTAVRQLTPISLFCLHCFPFFSLFVSEMSRGKETSNEVTPITRRGQGTVPNGILPLSFERLLLIFSALMPRCSGALMLITTTQ